MWRCRICEKKTKKRANVVRHLKLIHGIDDRDFKNVIKDTNIGVVSHGKDRTPIVSNGLQSRMSSVGRPMSEGRPIEEGLHKNQSRDSAVDSEPEGLISELSGYRPRSIPEDSKEKIDRFDFKMEDKCHILDSILDIFPDYLKADAKDICNTLKCRNYILIKHNWEVAIHVYTIRGSNVYTMIVNELTRRGEKFA